MHTWESYEYRYVDTHTIIPTNCPAKRSCARVARPRFFRFGGSPHPGASPRADKFHRSYVKGALLPRARSEVYHRWLCYFVERKRWRRRDLHETGLSVEKLWNLNEKGSKVSQVRAEKSTMNRFAELKSCHPSADSFPGTICLHDGACEIRGETWNAMLAKKRWVDAHRGKHDTLVVSTWSTSRCTYHIIITRLVPVHEIPPRISDADKKGTRICTRHIAVKK